MKKLIVLMLVVVMVLGLTASVIGARGPANKATGSVLLKREGVTPNRYVEFDAHEAKDENDDAKGKVYWYLEGVEGELRFELDVICCNVDDGVAWFAAGPTGPGDANPDLGYLVFKVVDGGTPGDNGDTLSVKWVLNRDDACSMVESGADPLGLWPIIGGNLVVHFYE